MELIELENIWKEYDRKVMDNARLNKEILKRMLIVKPERRLTWMKIWAAFNLLSPLILLLIVLMADIQFQITSYFYIGLCLFVPAYLLTYMWEVKYFRLVRKIDFSAPILTIKKKIAELEKYKITITRNRYILMPFAIIGILLMILQGNVFTSEFLVFLFLIVVVFLLSVYVRFKYSINERFKKLNQEIEEINDLEK